MTPRNLVICAFAIFSGGCGGVADYVFEEGSEADGDGDGTDAGSVSTTGSSSGTGSGAASSGSTSGSSGSSGSTATTSGSTGPTGGSSGSTGSTAGSSGSMGSTAGSGATSGGWGSTAGSISGFWPIDPSTCSNHNSSTYNGYCSLEVQCDGKWASIACSAYGSLDQSECYCIRPDGTVTMQMDASQVSNGTACENVSDVCVGLSELSATGPVDCSQRYLQSYDSYCAASLQCQTPLQVNGIEASLQTYVDVGCDNSFGNTLCQCYSGDHMATFTFTGDDFSSLICTDVLDLCQDAAFDPSLPSECVPRSQDSQGESCSFNVECSQDRVLSDRAAVVSTWQYGSCQKSPDGQWSCSCGDGSSPFVLPSTSAWDTCSAASLQCAAR